MSLAKNIIRVRERAGMSQADLAAKIGKSRSSVCEYEKGDHDPTLKVLVDIARVCETTLDELTKSNPEAAPSTSNDDAITTDTATPSA